MHGRSGLRPVWGRGRYEVFLKEVATESSQGQACGCIVFGLYSLGIQRYLVWFGFNLNLQPEIPFLLLPLEKAENLATLERSQRQESAGDEANYLLW